MGKNNKNSKNKKYIQAVKYYEEGYIDKAIKKCEESIADDLKNASTLNLKGLLLYLRGDLKGAVATWKINSDFNNDDIAKNYIADSKCDKDKIKLYKEAEVLLTKMHVNEALEKLKLCKVSDFNTIKVNLALAICYMRKGQYEYVAAHLTRVLAVDKENNQAKKIAKELQKYSGTKLQVLKSAKSGMAALFIKVVAVCAIILILIGGGYYILNNLLKANDNVASNDSGEVLQEEDIDTSSEPSSNDNSSEDENNLGNNANNKSEAYKVDVDKMQQLIDSKNYNDIYNELEKINIDTLQNKELAVCKLAKEMLENEGAEYFYNQAMIPYKANDYNSALKEFDKAYKYSSKTYLASEILFFDAAVNEKIKNNSRAISLYEEYYNKYKKGDYLEETLYNLAMLYRSEDLTKAKKYAEELRYDHSESMYNNENIKSLLK